MSSAEERWTAERKRLMAKIDEQAETIYQLKYDTAPKIKLNIAFPTDLPTPFAGMKLWCCLHEHRGDVVRYETISEQHTFNANSPIRSIHATVSKIRRHLRKHKLHNKYKIVSYVNLGYKLEINND